MKSSFTLDHIGIAVETLEKGNAFYEALGLGPMHVEEVPSEKVRVGFYELANGARVELLEPTSEDSPIAKFLETRGPGVQQVCFKVQDLKATIAELKAKGVKMINEEPRVGAGNCLVAFVHPKSAGGVLVELSQSLGGHK